MAKLPSSFRDKNKTARQFREQYAGLPKEIQKATRASCVIFDKNPRHPSLHYHELYETKRGQHHPKSISVSVTMQYRAIFVVRNGKNMWYWIGTHADYEPLYRQKIGRLTSPRQALASSSRR
jgi:hypothetical protein